MREVIAKMDFFGLKSATIRERYAAIHCGWVFVAAVAALAGIWFCRRYTRHIRSLVIKMMIMRIAKIINSHGQLYDAASSLECADRSIEAALYAGGYSVDDGKEGAVRRAPTESSWSLSHGLLCNHHSIHGSSCKVSDEKRAQRAAPLQKCLQLLRYHLPSDHNPIHFGTFVQKSQVRFGCEIVRNCE